MDDLALFEEDESLEQLCCVGTDLFDIEPTEFSFFQVLEQISVEKLKDEALVLSEVDMLHESHNVVFVARVLVHQESQ